MKKILIIDDSRINIKILTDVLEGEGYVVEALMDATKVMEVVLKFNPDTILLDIVMPKIDGIEVCKILQENEDTRNIPIIMVTAVTDSGILKQAFEAGAFDYIKKPFEVIEVMARINSAIRYYEQQKKLENLVLRDGLTQLYNHRAIMKFAETEYKKAQTEKYSFAFVMLDIDFFKYVNDTYGHMAGDCVLEVLASIISEKAEDRGIVGRYGGEEFCCIITDDTLENIKKLSETIRKAIEMHNFKCGNMEFKITTSIGIAYKNPSADIPLNQVIMYADKNLYEAKARGRNRIEFIEF